MPISLLSAQITNEQFENLFESFKRKLELLDEIKKMVDREEVPYNRLISEVMFWAFSILEDNDISLPKRNSPDLKKISMHIVKSINAFEMDRSSFYSQITNRYGAIAGYLENVYNINKELYIETDDTFKQKNRKLSQGKEVTTTNYQELRINKPEPTTYTIDDICRLMKRERFLVRPPYQREEVINRKKSSEIIESLLLGIKLPPIFIFKKENGISEVIDGQQRILSILAFLGKGYMNEKGEDTKSKKNGFSLQLKDSILTNLQGKHFSQLDEDMQEKITGFGLWVIEISQKNNPEFDPLDLFIRLNNKPYPIKSDTFEMWNSYLDRGLIDTIKLSYNNCSNWFFMRKMSNRMENENNYTVLSYFSYLKGNQQDAIDKGPLDIYKVGSRIAFRLRSKGEISKILENAEKKNDFIDAVNSLEFSFISNLKCLLTDGRDAPTKVLTRNLDEMLGAENNKRTQQSFYALWYFLKNLDLNSLQKAKKEIRLEVRGLFESMSSDISIHDFKQKVEVFERKYKNNGGRAALWGKIGDITTLDYLASEELEAKNVGDIYIKRDNRIGNRLEVLFDQPEKQENYIGLKIKREGFTSGYIAAVLQSSYVFRRNDFVNRILNISMLKAIEFPILSLKVQKIFDKIIVYTQSGEYIHRNFFTNMMDRIVEEVYLHELFEFYDVSLLGIEDKLKDLGNLETLERNEQIESIYNAIISDKNGFFAELSAATGITESYNAYEEN